MTANVRARSVRFVHLVAVSLLAALPMPGSAQYECRAKDGVYEGTVSVDVVQSYMQGVTFPVSIEIAGTTIKGSFDATHEVGGFSETCSCEFEAEWVPTQGGYYHGTISGSFSRTQLWGDAETWEQALDGFCDFGPGEDGVIQGQLIHNGGTTEHDRGMVADVEVEVEVKEPAAAAEESPAATPTSPDEPERPQVPEVPEETDEPEGPGASEPDTSSGLSGIALIGIIGTIVGVGVLGLGAVVISLIARSRSIVPPTASPLPPEVTAPPVDIPDHREQPPSDLAPVDAPPVMPPNTAILQGPDSLEWLRNRGLIAQNPDGSWVKTRDWDNAVDDPTSGLEGYSPGPDHDGSTADLDAVILVHSPGPSLGPPETPDAPETPDWPETSREHPPSYRHVPPEAPELPEAPETFDAPEPPDWPETSRDYPPSYRDVPPEAPETPDAPEPPKAPEPPDAPGPPDDPGPPDRPDTPTSVADPIADIRREYRDHVDPDRAANLSSSDIAILPDADFEKRAIKAGSNGNEAKNWSGFYDDGTGSICVRKGFEDRGLTAVHEFMHKMSNQSGFRPQETDAAGNVATVEKLGSGLEEAFTEHFTNGVARSHGMPVSDSTYNTDGRVKVAEAIEAAVGRDILGNAYFGKGAGPVNELITAVDKKFGAGTWERVRDLCNERDAAGTPATSFTKARTLLTPAPSVAAES